MILIKQKENFSTLLILPLVANENERYDEYIGPEYDNNNFINGYSADVNRPWNDEHIALAFDASHKYRVNKNDLITKDSFTDNYTPRINGDFFDIYFYRVRDKFKSDYLHILNGDYSLISTTTKLHIMNFWCRSDDSMLHYILFGVDIKFNKPDTEVIPEEDYLEKWVDLID